MPDCKQRLNARSQHSGAGFSFGGMMMGHDITETLDLNLKYDVILMQAGDNRIEMITALQTVSALDVAEADRFLGILPRMVLECTPWPDALAAKRTLEQAGARVELRLCQ